MKVTLLCLLPVVLVLSACRSEFNTNGRANIDRQVSSPQLIAFNVIDSYDVNTEFDGNIPLAVSPFQDDGFFEISWYVDNFEFGFEEDYLVYFHINDQPQITNSIFISGNFCGPLDSCNSIGYQQCFYNSDLSVTCTLPNSGFIDTTTDISELFLSIPEQLYMIIEICNADGFECDRDSWPVLFE